MGSTHREGSSESSSSDQQRRYLDDDDRFGFMRKGRIVHCKKCNIKIEANETRTYDNQQKEGPICLACSRRALGLSVDVAMSTPGQIGQIDSTGLVAQLARIADALEGESADPFDGSPKDASDPAKLSKRLTKIELFLAEAFGSQWDNFCATYKDK